MALIEIVVVLVALLMTSGCLADLGGETPGLGSRPNIIFIMADDHAVRAVSAYGFGLNQTPNIDRLANEGVIFHNAMVTNAVCAPSRAAILTGLHSHLNGVTVNGAVPMGPYQQSKTFPVLLQQSGYQTALIGKWHLGDTPTGFDHYEILTYDEGQGTYYSPEMRTAAETRTRPGYSATVITDRVLDWLENKRTPGKPFLLLYQFKGPHRRWQPGPEWLDLYDDIDIVEPATLFDDYSGRSSAARIQEMEIGSDLDERDLALVPPDNLTGEELAAWEAAFGTENEQFFSANLQGDALVRWKYQRFVKNYLRVVAALDDNLGRVLDYLDRSGLAGETMVVYTSDQGFFLGEHGWFDKRWMYEPSMRVPLIIRWPGVAEPGAETDELVQNIDFAQTFLHAAGAPTPRHAQGLSLLPLMKGGTAIDWRRSVYYRFHESNGPHNVARHYGVRTRYHKLIHYYENDEWELFDLEADPDEMNSVYGNPDYRSIQEELNRELERLRVQYADGI
jgi:arylsulfatase A-like enzyme